jgi:hypothetical protein
MDIKAIVEWVSLLPALLAGGKDTFDAIKQILGGATTPSLDAVIADAERRRALAAREALATDTGE